MKSAVTWLFMMVILPCIPQKSFGAAECNGWGDFRGIRVDGELMKFATSLRAYAPDWKSFAFTAAHKVRNPHWSRNGNEQIATGTIHLRGNQAISFQQTIEDTGHDAVKVTVQATAEADLNLAGVYYFVNLPSGDYDGGTARLVGSAVAEAPPTMLPAQLAEVETKYLTGKANGIRLSSKHRHIELAFESLTDIVVQQDRFIDTDGAAREGLQLPRDTSKDNLIAIYFPLGTGNLGKGQTVRAIFTIIAGGEIDTRPVHLSLDVTRPGAAFDGIGGNFRLQSPSDAAAVEYNLANLRVPWGRVAMPLDRWQPVEEVDAARAADSGQLNNHVREAMEMARTLSRKNIPVIISIWDMPEWGLVPSTRPSNGIAGRHVRREKSDAVYASIISYVKYLKKNYEVEPVLFTLNECDLGINILQTPLEHAQMIKELGARFAAEGLKTRMMLADAASPQPVKFLDAAMNDPEAVKYIGGVSYHSWHDGTKEEFIAWGEAARRLGVPLYVAEGGTDSDAYRYPAIFDEPWFALYEIDTYARICADSQPRSILHWQLTENYSILSGGGRTGQALRPARRFWQIKQMNLTPPGSQAIPAVVDSSSISCCAYRNQEDYVAHMVNNGATRQMTISGLPSSVKELHLYVTDAERGMKESPGISVADGKATFTLDKMSMTTLSSVARR
ncbi:MAG: hypothetical protein M3O30_08910 [Planctomycetota bacterium]|nr:hypothetical protein [Planctomycetota bacterium]